jgi:methionine--tRNA ligase beta chain
MKISVKQIFKESIKKFNSMLTSLDKQLGTISTKIELDKEVSKNESKQVVVPKEEKKVDKKENVKKPSKNEKPDPLISLFEECDLRVGHVVKLDYVENSEDIYKLKVDIGESEPREIGTGLRKHVPENQLLNQNVIVFSNLKPKKLLGKIPLT